MSLAQRVHFLQNMFQMTALTFVSVINKYHINGLHLFWDTLYIILEKLKQTVKKNLIIFCYWHEFYWNFNSLDIRRKWLFSLITVVKVSLVVAKSHNFLKTKFSEIQKNSEIS